MGGTISIHPYNNKQEADGIMAGCVVGEDGPDGDGGGGSDIVGRTIKNLLLVDQHEKELGNAYYVSCCLVWYQQKLLVG